ncbi:antitoxin VapB47 [Mycobacterium noviomagense]|uniref:Antitoxin n=2 Tax=Mycobacterium noviomagense TaxID=459858 RepID=A0A7I7PCH8_9MYCO|nr:prevent-host-death family antitoxin [Mycobacterium noviomagense]BBY06321.1 antitoxin VapB47 [Mycobacterium noviomagense]
MCYMERIGVRELRQNASRYLARVATGETFEITQRGRLVARIVPAGGDPWADLVAAGEVIPASADEDLLAEPPGDFGPGLSDALERLREDER